MTSKPTSSAEEQISGPISMAEKRAGDSEVGEEELQKSTAIAVDDDDEYSYKEQRKIVHKIDRRLVVMAGVMYCVSLMDRNNLPNAAIAGMTQDLELNVGFRYSTVALVFFITYTLFQPPATILMRFIGPRIFLAGLCVAWGVVMICFGFPNSWEPMIGLRIILGLLEAGFFPGSIYLIAAWYSRYDLQKRYAVFYMLGCVASGGSGILAYGLQQMDGLGNYAGWRWIFIIEGLMTVVIGVAGYIFLVDFPDQAVKRTYRKFLTTKEIEFIIRRINRDRGDAIAEDWNFNKWLASGKDWKIWSFALMYFCLTTMAYALSFFLPIILRENMGFSVAEAQCLSAPQYVAAAIVMWAAAWVGDRWHFRGPVLLFACTLTYIGLPLMGFASQIGARFFGTFLVAIGPNVAIPAALAYQANNIRGHWKRAFASASLIGFGGIGGISGSLVFRTQDSPHYRPGIYAALACNSLIVILVTINTIIFRRENRKADRGEKILEGDPTSGILTRRLRKDQIIPILRG